MCGLAVTLSFDGRPADGQTLARMTDVIRHRGPDDEGFAVYGPVGFGFRRLAILDLSPAGHQPMETPDGLLSIVFNGEIYNYIELRRELEQSGHTFRTTGDTEVLLAAYRQWGLECARRFNGMWAFVIYDRAARKLIASRDRFGVKPLYRFRGSRSLVLASEIKAILASGAYTRATNWSTAARFLGRGRLDEATETFYEGIDQIAPGTTVEIPLDGSKTTEHRFWSIEAIARGGPAQPVDAFRELLEDAVRVRMRSDVPVGVCLSGGIDSNAIISIMSALWPAGAPNRLQAFSYIPERYSEATYIQESIARTGAELNELTVTPERLLDVLPAALWHYDEPVHSATALIGFELMRLARSRGVTVVLNGQGADEVNAGYYPYFRQYWADLVHRGEWARAWREVDSYARGHQVDRRPLLQHAVGHAVRTRLEGLPGYLARAGARRRTRLERDSWLTPETWRAVPLEDVQAPSMNLDRALQYAVERRPLPIYLRVEDRNSMAHSIEARLPFLDYRLVSLAFALPAEWKLRGPWNKFIVREATKGTIAEKVRTRLDKMGFPTPSREWFSGPWYGPMRDLIGSRALRESGVIDVGRAQTALERHRAGTTDETARLFHLAQFALWLDGPPAAPARAAASSPELAASTAEGRR